MNNGNEKRTRTVEEEVTDVLKEISVPAHIKGHGYLRAAIMLTVEDFSVIHSVTKVLYPTVAEEFNTTPSRVERAIRHAIKVAFRRSTVEDLQKWFGSSANPDNGTATNSEFIATIADKIILGRRQNSKDLEE